MSFTETSQVVREEGAERRQEEHAHSHREKEEKHRVLKELGGENLLTMPPRRRCPAKSRPGVNRTQAVQIHQETRRRRDGTVSSVYFTSPPPCIA